MEKLRRSSRVVFDLPVVKQWGEETYESCSARRNDHDHFEKDCPTLEARVKDKFGELIATIVTHVLTLSLLVTDLSSCRLHFDEIESDQFARNPATFVIYSVLTTNLPFSLGPLEVMENLKMLLGHDHEHLPHGRWIASSDKGQIILPSLFESMRLRREPYLQIYCYPGILLSQDKPFGPPLKVMVSDQRDQLMTAGNELDMVTVPTAQIGSLSRFSSLQYEWRTRRVSGRSSEIMTVHLCLKASTGYYAKICPFQMLTESMEVLFAPKCTHPLEDTPNDAVKDYCFVHPESFFRSCKREDNGIAVYAVRGNDALRLMLLGFRGSYDPSEKVVSANACLSCGLIFCKKACAKLLIC